MIIGGIILLIMTVNVIRYNRAIVAAKERFASYSERTETIETSYGKLTYIDEGKGETVLVCHGICGGYDQAYDTFADNKDSYRILAPSRFGYPGSDVPKDPGIDSQVEALVELLDAENIDNTYILGTSAGGATAIKFAIRHPERTKGLILFCSGFPAMKEPDKKLTYVGPPEVLCKNFPMWFFSPFFGPVMGMDSKTINVILPLEERREGILLDARISNTDMDNNYKDYDMQELKVPVLIFHAKDDKLADYDRAAAWAKKIPDVTFVSFETGGHLMKGNSKKIDAALKIFMERK